MTEDTSSFSRQSFLVLALFSCFAAGLEGLVLNFMQLDVMPDIWGLTIPGSIGLLLASGALSTVFLGRNKAFRLAVSYALLFYGLLSLLLPLIGLDHGRLEHSFLPAIPAFFAVLVAACCGVSLTDRTKPLWFITGALSLLVGISAVLHQVGFIEFTDLFSLSEDPMPVTGALFATAFGVMIWTMALMPGQQPLSIPNSAIRIGCTGAAMALFLMYLAIANNFHDKQKAATDLLENFSLTIQQATRNREELLQRMIERWSRLPEDEGREIREQDARLVQGNQPSLFGFALFNSSEASSPSYIATSKDAWIEAQLKKSGTGRWLQQFNDSGASASWYFPDDEAASHALIAVRSTSDHELTLIGAHNLATFIQKEARKDPGTFLISISRDGSAIAPLMGASTQTGKNAFTYAAKQVQLPQQEFTLTLEAQSDFQVWGSQLHHYVPAGILLFGLVFSHQLMLSHSLNKARQRQSRELALSEQRFRSLFERHPDAVFSLDRAGRYQATNPVVERTLGVSASSLIGCHFASMVNLSHVSESDLSKVYDAYTRAVAGESTSDFTMELTGTNHQTRTFNVTLLPTIIEGKVAGVFGIAKDITKRVQAEEMQRIMKRSLEASNNAVVITDARVSNYPVVYVNPAFTDITGYTFAEVYGQPLDFLIGSGTDTADIEFIRKAVNEQRSASLTIRSYRKDGAPFWNHLVLSPVRDDQQILTHFIGIMNDIWEKKEQDRELAYQATHDALTGLGNRSLFNDRLYHDFELARRHNRLIAVLFIDLDEFKPINDTMGHKAGDKLLISVTQRLKGVIRPSDTLARFGGDEFVLLLPDLSSPGDAEEIADRILDEFSKAHRVDNNELYISASIGIATITDELNYPEKLLQQADMAMYKAKQQGRNTYETYSNDMDAKLAKRVTLRNDLQEAIKNEQLHLNYQPVVDRDGRFAGLEALLRWNHPRKGFISPADFIPIAEETGQITPLGRWVTRQACKDALRLLDLGLLRGCVAVNLSPLQFHRPDFLSSLRKILTETGLPPQYLELELTEGILMKDTDGAIELLNELTALGVSSAIDDFGTGYSSFGYLRELPVDKIKIDRSFVNHVTTSEKDSAVCKGVITLARELDLKIVAEGVETAEQYEYLRDNGCSGFQGYYFARPMPLDELIDWINGSPE